MNNDTQTRQIGDPALQPGHTLSAPFNLKPKRGHTCQMCGTIFLSIRRTGVKYCSATCRKRASNGHKTWNTHRRCEQCGKGYTISQPHQWHRYCSNACRQAAYRARKREAES
jgi:hypothetical protein